MSGNPAVVRGGTLTIIVSGPRGRRGRASTRCCDAIGPTVLYVGEGERGARRQARPPGADRRHRRAARARRSCSASRRASSARSCSRRSARPSSARAFVEYKTEPLLRDDYSATFTTAMMLKDVDLVLDLASERRLELPVHGPAAARCSRTPSSAATRTRTSSRSSAGCGKRASRSQQRQGTGEPGDDEHRVARRDDGGRLGAADRLRPAARGPARAGEGRARGVRPRRAAAVRPEQHPLRHEHAHRRVGARQERALGAAAARRRPDPVGLRLGGAPPPAVRAVAAGGELPRRRRRRCAARCRTRPASPTRSR